MGGVWSASTTLWESTVGGLCIGEFCSLGLGQNLEKDEATDISPPRILIE